jgi:hypothetical protein
LPNAILGQRLGKLALDDDPFHERKATTNRRSGAPNLRFDGPF